MSLQKLILKSKAARLLAIRQVTQLNAGKKTARHFWGEGFLPKDASGIDGKKFLTHEERFELEKLLKASSNDWKHQKLRSIPIPKKDGSTRMLKIPTMADRAWQCLAKYALEDERVHLHHIDGNHSNWKNKNLVAIHESCHDYVHMGKREQQP